MKQFYGAKDIQDLTGVSESKAYLIIKQLNGELADKGYITIRGKVPRAYMEDRFFGLKPSGSGRSGGD
jgi:hypothetical protein